MKGDFYIDENFEMKIQNGDFLINEDTKQDVHLIIKTNPGNIRYLPKKGVGVQNYLNSNDSLSFKRRVIEVCKSIKVKISKIYVDFTNGEWDVDIGIKNK